MDLAESDWDSEAQPLSARVPAVAHHPQSASRHLPRIESSKPVDAVCIVTLGRFDVLLPAGIGPQRHPTWRSSHALLLFKCLLAAPGYRLAREHLLEALWPEYTSEQAHEALRHGLAHLRSGLEPERAAHEPSRYIGSTYRDVWLLVDHGRDDTCAGLWVDRERFEALATQALDLLERNPGRDDWEDAAQMTAGHRLAGEALALYQGAFLADDAELQWIQARRMQCLRLWSSLVRCLIDLAVAEQQLERALYLLGHLVDRQPDDEDAAADFMCVQAAMGHRAEAMRTYEHLCSQLSASLGIRPMREVQELASAIRHSESLQDLRLLAIRRLSRRG